MSRTRHLIDARIGSTQCVIDDGVDGLLVDPQCPEDLAVKIVIRLSGREKREKMGVAAYSKTLAHYTWDKVVDRVETLYRDLHAVRGATNAGSWIYGDSFRESKI